jgi:2-phospho-L-lactate guanylyltransferase
MNAVLLPVRSVTGAKNRLATDLDEQARKRLTLAMLADMIAAARKAERVSTVYVISSDTALLRFASDHGATCLAESALLQRWLPAAHAANASPAPSGGLNRAVFCAARELASRGIERLLAIPGDVPLITAANIDEAFAPSTVPVVLIPSRTRRGTNGLLTSPPDVVTPVFEGESLSAYRRVCAEHGLLCSVVDLPSFALDIDTFDDLRMLAAAGRPTEATRVAEELVSGVRANSPRPPRAEAAEGPFPTGEA